MEREYQKNPPVQVQDEWDADEILAMLERQLKDRASTTALQRLEISRELMKYRPLSPVEQEDRDTDKLVATTERMLRERNEREARAKQPTSTSTSGLRKLRTSDERAKSPNFSALDQDERDCYKIAATFERRRKEREAKAKK
jgi:hypothetical protein